MRITHAAHTFVLVLAFLGLSGGVVAQKQPVDYVNPYMGNISHLLVPSYPTIHLPNSLIRVYPNRNDFTGVLLHGLPVVVTSHRGTKAFCLSPFQGNEKDIKPVLEYSYDLEKLTPYSYSVYLDEQRIQVDFGLSHQSAAYKMQFEKDAPAYLAVNSGKGEMVWDGKAVSGFQLIENDTKVFIYLVPEETPVQISKLNDGTLTAANSATGQNACLVLNFPRGTKTLNVSYGISFVSVIQAKENLNREVTGKTVDELQRTGREIWNEALSKLEISGGTDNEKSIFYTSLYRFYERSVCISETGRYYSPFDKSIHNDNGRMFYTDDWTWDSYRAHHPLRTLINPSQEEDILNSLVLMAEQSEKFWMPTFPGITGDFHGMNCNHVVAPFLDAYRKGLRGFDLEKAYEACKGSVTEKTLAPWSGKPAGKLNEFYKQHGYIPALKEDEKETIPDVGNRHAVAVTLGTSYDEWCLSEIAQELGKADDAKLFRNSSLNYRNIFNPETKFFHPKDSDGKFIQPFDYKFSGGKGARRYFCENNGWIYRWDVLHNIPDLIELMGGREAFVKNLDTLFSEPLGKSKFEFYAQLPDHTGNVGQFSMGNEPSLHIPYLYNYAGQPWKTQKCIRKLIGEWFRNDLMGIPGDEDGGGISSFVVFSMMGFYPVTPGESVYTIGSPIFDQVKVHLGNGKIFEIEARNVSADNKYIHSATINGKVLEKPWLKHEDLTRGGSLILEMGPKANLNWGCKID